jgi:hypothetical protein
LAFGDFLQGDGTVNRMFRQVHHHSGSIPATRR